VPLSLISSNSLLVIKNEFYTTIKKEIEGLILISYQHRLRNSVFMQKKVVQR